MSSTEMKFDYYLLVSYITDYMYKAAKLEIIDELYNDELDVVYGVKTERGVGTAFCLQRKPDGTYVCKKDDDVTLTYAGLVYILRVFQPLVDLDRPGLLDRVRNCRLDIFDYYLIHDRNKPMGKLYKTTDRHILYSHKENNEFVWGVLNEFGRDRAYLVDVPLVGWPRFKNCNSYSIGVVYLEAVYGPFMEL